MNASASAARTAALYDATTRSMSFSMSLNEFSWFAPSRTSSSCLALDLSGGRRHATLAGMRPLEGGVGELLEKALDFGRSPELEPVQPRVFARSPQRGELLGAATVRGDGPPHDGIAGEERAPQRLTVAMPQLLLVQQTP